MIIERDPLKKQQILAQYYQATKERNSPFSRLNLDIIQKIFAYSAGNWRSLQRTCHFFYKIVNDSRIVDEVPALLASFNVRSLSELLVYHKVDQLFKNIPSVFINYTERRFVLLGTERIISGKSDRFTYGSANYNLEFHIQNIRTFIYRLQRRGFNPDFCFEISKYVQQAERFNGNISNFRQKLIIMGFYQLPPRAYMENIGTVSSKVAIWKDEHNRLGLSEFLPWDIRKTGIQFYY